MGAIGEPKREIHIPVTRPATTEPAPGRLPPPDPEREPAIEPASPEPATPEPVGT